MNNDSLIISYTIFYIICKQITYDSFWLSIECIRNLIFGGCLCYLSITDWRTHRIPNGCLLIAMSSWFLAALVENMEFLMFAVRILSTAVLGSSIFLISFLTEKILKKHCLGYGDMKLYMVTGLYLGFTASMFSILLSCFFGLLFETVRVLFYKQKNTHFPFGPCIALASWIMLLYGQPLVNWYLHSCL